MTAVEDHRLPVRLAGLALQAAIEDDWPRVERALTRLGRECGAEGTWLAFMGWIDTYAHHAVGGEAHYGRVNLTPCNAETGSTSGAGMSPYTRWAMRLVHARISDDEARYVEVMDELPVDGVEVGRYAVALLSAIALTIRTLPFGYALDGRGSS